MNFEPWQGGRYGSSNNLGLPKRLLVLGESHYGEKENAYPGLTKEVLEEVFAEAVDVRLSVPDLHESLHGDLSCEARTDT